MEKLVKTVGVPLTEDQYNELQEIIKNHAPNMSGGFGRMTTTARRPLWASSNLASTTGPRAPLFVDPGSSHRPSSFPVRYYGLAGLFEHEHGGM